MYSQQRCTHAADGGLELTGLSRGGRQREQQQQQQQALPAVKAPAASLSPLPPPPLPQLKTAVVSAGLDLAVQMQTQDRRFATTLVSRAPGKSEALRHIERFVDSELRAVERDDPSGEPSYHRLNVYRQAFRMVTTLHTTYAQILESIMAEYERFITDMEQRMHTPAKARQEVVQQFELEVSRLQKHMQDTIAGKEEELAQRHAALNQREREVQVEAERLRVDNERLQNEVTRLHDQNLTLAHNVVDYRFQNQRIERELKEVAAMERRYTKLKQEHQVLLESISVQRADSLDTDESVDPSNTSKAQHQQQDHDHLQQERSRSFT